MEPRTRYTVAEVMAVRRLLTEKLQFPSRSREARSIRKELRDRYDFSSEKFVGRKLFTPRDLDMLIERNQIEVLAGDTAREASHESRSPAALPGRAEARVPRGSKRDDSDEAYVIDLCDEILGRGALRQHRFPFLTGDAGHSLPVDAYYPELNLVVEYRERQHAERVKFFDRRITVSGVHRGEQRRLYDQRRREVLPQNGISLVEVSCTELAHSSSKRLQRDRCHDREVLRRMLASCLPVTVLE